MSTIGNKGGKNKLVEYTFIATQGQSLFQGNDNYRLPLSFRASPGLVRVSVNGNKISRLSYSFVGSTGIQLTASCNSGDIVEVEALYPYNSIDYYTTAQSDLNFNRRRNRIIDPGMRISQEQGNNSLTLASGTGLYPSDSFSGYRSGSTGGATIQRISLITPGGSPYRIRTTITAVNTSPASGDLLAVATKIEGLDIADLKFGSIAAKTIAIRLGIRSSIAGSFGVSVQNGSSNRSYIASFSVLAAEVGLDIIKTIFLTVDQTGTWNTDNTLGLQLSICLCVGSTYQGVAGWQAGNLYGLAANTNMMSTNNSTFDLFDIGLYDVTGMASGVLPYYELNDWSYDYDKCLRYYEISYKFGVLPGTNTQDGSNGHTFYALSGAAAAQPFIVFKKDKRVTASITGFNPVTGAANQFYDYTSGGANGSLTVDFTNSKSFRFYNGSNSWSTNDTVGIAWVANARM